MCITYALKSLGLCLLWEGVVGGVEIIRDVLEVCLGGASKTRIVYRANLNFSRLDRYLGLLLGLGFLAAEDDASGGVVYRTTEAGRNFLNGCLKVEGVRGLEKRLVKVQGGV